MNARQRHKRRRQRWIGKRAAKLTLFGMFAEATKGMKPIPYRDRSAETVKLLRAMLPKLRVKELPHSMDRAVVSPADLCPAVVYVNERYAPPIESQT